VFGPVNVSPPSELRTPSRKNPTVDMFARAPLVTHILKYTYVLNKFKATNLYKFMMCILVSDGAPVAKHKVVKCVEPDSVENPGNETDQRDGSGVVI